MNLHRWLVVLLALFATAGCVQGATGPRASPYPLNDANTRDRGIDGSGGGSAMQAGSRPSGGEDVDGGPFRIIEHSGNTHTGMQPLYLARIEHLGRGDLVQVDCAACPHVALLTPDFLLRLGLSREVDLISVFLT